MGGAVKDAQEHRETWAKIVHDHHDDEETIRKEISETNASLKRLHDLREDLRQKDKEAHADDIADRVDDLEDHKNDLLLALDDKKERSKEAEKTLEDARDRVKAAREKREARRKSREGNGDLTAHFSIAEFNCHNGAKVPQAAIPALKRLCVEHLEPLRAALGGPIRINSGYRTAAYNASIGGATSSYHIYDIHPGAPAADHVVGGHSASEVQKWHDSHNAPDGMGYYAGFTHIDDRGYHSRWWGAS